MSQIKIYSSERIDKSFRELAMKRFGYSRGSISKAAEEALLRWINDMTRIDGLIAKLMGRAKNDDRILAIILFGSFARKETNFRDVDVGLVAFRNDVIPAIYDDYASLIGGEGMIDLSIINSLPLDVQSSVFDDAVILYCRDGDALYDYTLNVIKKSADVRHVISEELGTI